MTLKLFSTNFTTSANQFLRALLTVRQVGKVRVDKVFPKACFFVFPQELESSHVSEAAGITLSKKTSDNCTKK